MAVQRTAPVKTEPILLGKLAKLYPDGCRFAAPPRYARTYQMLGPSPDDEGVLVEVPDHFNRVLARDRNGQILTKPDGSARMVSTINVVSWSPWILVRPVLEGQEVGTS